MTVNELMEELAKYPGDSQVWIGEYTAEEGAWDGVIERDPLPQLWSPNSVDPPGVLL